MPSPDDHTVKVSNVTKERLRLAAAISGKSQQEIVDGAVQDYIARTPEEWREGLEKARQALGLGEEVAYLLSEEPSDALKVAPLPEDRLVRSDGPFSEFSAVKRRGRGG